MKRLILSWLIALCPICLLSAQSLEECRRLAREHYPAIRQYDLISQSEKYNLSNAAKAWLPQLSLSAQATWQSEVSEFPEAFNYLLESQGQSIPGMQHDQYKLAVEVRQNIWDGGQYEANRSTVTAEADEQRRRTDIDLYELSTRVEDIYFGILLLDENIAQTQALVTLLESNLSHVRAFVRNGAALQSDADAVEAELLSARQSLRRIESSRAGYRRMLELFIGQPLSSGGLQRPDEPALDACTFKRPELSLLDAQDLKLDARMMSVKASVMPRIGAFAQGYYGYPGLNMFQSMTSTEWSPGVVVGLSLSWNLSSLYTRRDRLAELSVARRQIELQRDMFLFNMHLQQIQDDAEIGRLRETVSDDARIVELRRSVRLSAESKFDNGVIGTSELLQKISEETEAQLSLSSHEIELLRTLYRQSRSRQ